MERENGNKALRVLSMYQKLMNNQIVNKAEEAAAYGVNSRTIQRNIDDIRGFLETTDSAGISKQIVYDQKERGYRLEEVYDENLTAGEALDVCKILIDSRAFPKDKMKKLIYQIVGSSVPEPEQKHIYELVNNELFHYIEPRHKTDCQNPDNFSVVVEQLTEPLLVCIPHVYPENKYQNPSFSFPSASSVHTAL